LFRAGWTTPAARAKLADVKAICGVLFGWMLAFSLGVRADEPVNLAGGPPAAPMDVNEAHGRLEITYLLVPEAKMAAFADGFDANGTAPDLDALLKQTGGKIVASATTNLVLGGDGVMLEIDNSRLTLRPRIASSTQFHLDGRLTRATYSSTFDVLLAPGRYQLFLMWNQPPQHGEKDPYNAVVARMREIDIEGPNGEVRSLVASPGPQPAPAPAPGPASGEIPPAPPPLPKKGRILYDNPGTNTEGFAPKSDSPHFINYLSDASATWEIFHDHLSLASARAQKFPDQVWTHVTITRTGRKLTDNVGGQTLSADLPANLLVPKLSVGLGYYATQNVGGNGQMDYANLRVVRR
jgi:hypothetical protein